MLGFDGDASEVGEDGDDGDGMTTREHSRDGGEVGYSSNIVDSHGGCF